MTQNDRRVTERNRTGTDANRASRREEGETAGDDAVGADPSSDERPVPRGGRPPTPPGADEPSEPDPDFRRVAWHLFVSSAGAETRRRLLEELERRGPANANQLAGWLDCDYSTARHHLDRLGAEELVVTTGISNGYDVRYTLGPRLEANLEWVRSLAASSVGDDVCETNGVDDP